MKYEIVVQSDLDRIKELQPEGWPNIVESFQFYLDHDFCYPFKAVDENQLIGLGVSIVFKDTAWLAHIIVDENYRNQGIGYSITKFLVDVLKMRSIHTVLLIATALGEPVYEKLGFKAISNYVELKKEEPWKETIISKNIIPYQKEYYSRLLELDNEIAGEDRTYFIKKHIDKSQLYIEDGELKGFYTPDLGEGLIFASDAKAGIELLKLKHVNIDKAVLPEENSEGIQYLRKNGFGEPVLKGKRMVLGKNTSWRPECFYSRIGGNVG